ncbi:MAG: sporulation protein YunB [Clostridia bacterium]|nr:sporulation protein YunB [Clostridia bacterium]
MNIKTGDFTEEISGADLSHINLNSILINSVTNKIAAQLSENMNLLSYHEIQVPAGMFSGVPLFSRLGFTIPIQISSMGDAKADYETELASAGVNQVSYQVWLNIECNVTVVNPVFGKNLCVKRKLLLVNTIFNGKVPEGYANISLN